MGKKYSVEDSEEMVNLCLNCKKAKCNGACKELEEKKKKGKKNERDN